MRNSFANDFMVAVIDGVNPWFAVVVSMFIFAFIVLGVSPIRVTDEKKLLDITKIYVRHSMLIFTFLGFPLFFTMVYFVSKKLYQSTEYWELFLLEIGDCISILWPLLGMSLIGSTLWRFYYLRTIRPFISQFIRKHNVKQSADTLSDIRVEQANINSKTFDPRNYYKDDFFFMGLNGNNEPIYEKDSDWKKRHQKIVGPSQTGKGVLLGVQLDQAIRKGMCTFFFDQKPDDFIYDIMRESCEAAGREPPIVVDLNGFGIGNYGPFLHGTKRDRRARVLFAFGLESTGQQADYYKTRARNALDEVFDKWDGSLVGLNKLLHPKGAGFGDEDELLNGGASADIYEKSENIRDALGEWMALKPLCAEKGRGLDIERCIKENRVVYVRGSITDKLVKKAETVMLMDLIQTVIRNGKQPHHTYVSIDEVKFVVSDVLALGLATILSKGVSATIAYQSLSNLLSLEDKTLNAEAIKSEIEINTKTTVCYQAADNETADWAAELSGTIQKTVSKSEEVEINSMGAEEFTSTKRLSREEEYLIPANKLKTLPERVSAIYRPNQLAELLYTCWIPVKELKGIPLRETITQEKKEKEAAKEAAKKEPVVIEPVELRKPAPQPAPEIVEVDQEKEQDFTQVKSGVSAEPAEIEKTEVNQDVAEVEPVEPLADAVATGDGDRPKKAESVNDFMDFITGDKPDKTGNTAPKKNKKGKIDLPDF